MLTHTPTVARMIDVSRGCNCYNLIMTVKCPGMLFMTRKVSRESESHHGEMILKTESKSSAADLSIPGHGYSICSAMSDPALTYVDGLGRTVMDKNFDRA